MTARNWIVVKSIYCDRPRRAAQLLEERVYPAEVLPDGGAAYQVRARTCSLSVDCNLAGFPCRWAGTNPGYDPFEG